MILIYNDIAFLVMKPPIMNPKMGWMDGSMITEIDLQQAVRVEFPAQDSHPPEGAD